MCVYVPGIAVCPTCWDRILCLQQTAVQTSMSGDPLCVTIATESDHSGSQQWSLATYQRFEVAHKVIVTIGKSHEANVIAVMQFGNYGNVWTKVGQFLYCHDVRRVNKVFTSVSVIGSYWFT